MGVDHRLRDDDVLISDRERRSRAVTNTPGRTAT
jgi:hypothetical protein